MGMFSAQTITRLATIITGDSSPSVNPKEVGVYHSATDLEILFGNCNVPLSFGPYESRMNVVRRCLNRLNEESDYPALSRIIEASLDCGAYRGEEEKLERTVQYLNEALTADGYEVRLSGDNYKLLKIGTYAAVSESLAAKATAYGLDSVKRDADRALEQAESDPPGAITAACSMVESVCKSILADLNEPLPKDKGISGLVKATMRILHLTPDSEANADIKRVLSGLANVADGIGSLRTHVGDAHGRTQGTIEVEARVARFAVHAAGTISLFFIETWEKQRQRNGKTD